ncbi:MAG: hypothetical protein ACI870_000197 [Crocinitomicaceae bacterium]|jgi:hypothetical protein
MNTQQQPDIKIKKPTHNYFTKPRDFGMLVVGIISVLYIMNISIGLIEILPDNLPFIGNIDEAVVSAILISVFYYFGIDITRFFKRK